MIPQELTDIQNFLIEQNVQLLQQFQDGRINASINEPKIIDVIERRFKIDKPRSRHWYDFALMRGSEKIPVNIKITSTSTADNVQCKLGMYYALTGVWPNFANEISWEEYCKLLKQNLSTEKNKDYYFLVINKNNPRDVFCTSLKQICTLVPNGNNLPFQCIWGENRELCQRTHDEAVKFILGVFRDSIKLRAKIINDFEDNLGDVV